LYNIALSANPIGLVVIGIAALVGIIALVASKFESFGEFFSYFWDSQAGLLENMGKLFVKLNPFWWLLNLVDMVFPGIKDKVVGFFSDLWDSIFGFIKPLLEFFGFGDDVAITADVNHNITDETKPKTDAELSVTDSKTTDTKIVADNGYSSNMPMTNNSGKESNVSSSTQKEGAGFASAEKKEINTRIENLVKEININVPDFQMTKSQLKKYINEALVSAIRDTELGLS